MTDRAGAEGLRSRYDVYLRCLDGRDWGSLSSFVTPDVIHNGRVLGSSGYRTMLENVCRETPGLVFVPNPVVCEPPLLSCRLTFDRRGVDATEPVAEGEPAPLAEHAVYRFEGDRIAEVWSLVDRVDGPRP